MKLIVTGGCGFIGSHFVDLEVNKNDEIIIIDNLLVGKKDYIKNYLATGKVKFYENDIRNLDSIKSIFSQADAVIHFMNKKTKENLINIGTGKEMNIKQYAKFILDKLDLKMKIKFDNRYPDGTPRKVLDISLAKKNGWVAKTNLETGFNKTYKDFIDKKLYL